MLHLGPAEKKEEQEKRKRLILPVLISSSASHPRERKDNGRLREQGRKTEGDG